MNFPQCPKFSRPPCRSYEALADSATVCYSQILHLGRCKITMTACSIECYMLLLSKFDSVWLWLGLWIEPMDLSDESCCLMDGLDGVVGVVPMWLHGWLPDNAETTVPRTPDSAVKINKI